MRLVEEMRRHCTCGGLAMRTGNAESFAAAGNRAQYLGTFMYLETILPEIGQFGMLLRNGRGVHHQSMLNVTPIKGMMTVIYEFPVDSETTLQNYDIYFTNEELTDEQKSLIEWYRDVFRPEDLRLVESVQKGLKSRGYRGQGRIMADSSGSGISEHGIAHFHNLLAQVFKD